MLTRLRTRSAQEEAGRQAVQSVLGNPDLVALVVERLPVTRLGFGVFCSKIDNSDRWAASQVNIVFRRTALRLPWDALWGQHSENDSPSGLRPLAILQSRNVQAWTVHLGSMYGGNTEEANSSAANVLNYAHSTETLSVASMEESTLSEWLHYALLPLPEACRSSSQGTPVLACLASLSRLTGLKVYSLQWNDALWVTGLRQLNALHLWGYCGPPIPSLPALESLCLENSTPKGHLEQWALPRLTALSCTTCQLHLGSPLRGPSAQRLVASASGPRMELSRLQRLELTWCALNGLETGFRELVPALTHLRLRWGQQQQEEMSALFSKGLPVGLKGLVLQGWSTLWSTVLELQDLVSLEVQQDTMVASDEAAALVSGLARLPHLTHAYLLLPVDSRDEARVEEGFRAMDALLLKRRGRLELKLAVKFAENE